MEPPLASSASHMMAGSSVACRSERVQGASSLAAQCRSAMLVSPSRHWELEKQSEVPQTREMSAASIAKMEGSKDWAPLLCSPAVFAQMDPKMERQIVEYRQRQRVSRSSGWGLLLAPASRGCWDQQHA